MAGVAVFPEINPLPRAERKAAAGDGDGEVDGGESFHTYHRQPLGARHVAGNLFMGTPPRRPSPQSDGAFNRGMILNRQGNAH